VLYQLGAVFSPLVVGPPMLFFFIYYGDRFMIWMFVVSWIMPMVCTYSLPPTWIESSCVTSLVCVCVTSVARRYYCSIWGFFFFPLLAVYIEQGTTTCARACVAR
jgi:hypothetical protein